MYKLEDRILFDGALPVDVVDVDAAATEIVENAEEITDQTDQSSVPNEPNQIDQANQAYQSNQIDQLNQTGLSFPTNELYIVDTTVSDYQTIQGNIPDDSNIIFTSPKDDIGSISYLISEYRYLNAIHVIGHASPGNIQLGSDILSVDSLFEHQEDLKAWNDSLVEGADILIYGCSVAGSEDGELLLGELARFTGADVAASVDQTGIDGNWELEYSTGTVEAGSLKVDTYQYNLENRTLVVSTVADEAYDGDETYADQNTGEASGKLSLREAIGIVNNDAANNYTITFDSALEGKTIFLGDIDGDGIVSSSETSTELLITESVKIDGADNDITIDGGWLDGDTDGDGILQQGEVADGNYQSDERGARIMHFDIGTNEGTLGLTNLSFTHGAATTDDGGALMVTVEKGGDATLVITGTVFEENIAIRHAGAIKAAKHASITIDDSTFINNTARKHGGAIRVSDNTDVTNCTFVGNSSGKGTDAISSTMAINIDHSTFVGQSASISEANVTNSLFTDGSVTATATVLTSINATDYFEDSDGIAGITAADLQYRGGNSPVFVLADTTAVTNNVIDKAVGSTKTTDQRGSAMVGDARDLGAFEVRPIPPISNEVTDNASANNSSGSDGSKYVIQDAESQAVSQPEFVITDYSATQNIVLSDPVTSSTRSFSIQGTGIQYLDNFSAETNYNIGALEEYFDMEDLEEADVNGDGVIDDEEYKAFLKMLRERSEENLPLTFLEENGNYSKQVFSSSFSRALNQFLRL